MREEAFIQKIEESFNSTGIPFNESVAEILRKALADTRNPEYETYFQHLSRLTIPGMLINSKGIILSVNSKFEDIFGYKRQDIQQTPLTTYIPSSQKEYFSVILTDLINGKEISEQEIKLLKKDGISAPVGFFAYNPTDQPNLTVILLRDLSIIKKLEKELTKSRVKLQKSEQFKSVFLANMSHEIRTPMNAIIGFSELINMEGISAEKRKDYSRIINQRGQQLLNLIDDIIEITKIETGRINLDFTWIDLDEFMNDLFSMVLQKKIKEGKDYLELILQKQESVTNYQIYTDTGRLHQIFTNLLFYVLKNTSKGNIVFGYNKLDEKEIEFHIHNPGNYLNPEEQKMLFEHFWKIEDTTHLKIKGAGLGLTIARNLIELFGGKISVQSDIHKGTSFIFRLPIIIPEEQKNEIMETHFKEETMLQDHEPNWKNKVILVVEDDLVNYQFIEALLEKSLAQLLHAETGQQALELCKTINKIDLILMDIKLPEKNGYEITREIKLFRKDIPIIAQTAFSLNDVKERCFESGCNDIITKPVDIDIFMGKLNRYLS